MGDLGEGLNGLRLEEEEEGEGYRIESEDGLEEELKQEEDESEGRSEEKKEEEEYGSKIRKNLEQIPVGYDDALIEAVTLVEAEKFNEALGKIGEIIEPYIGGSTGDVDCGDDYSNYNNIQKSFEDLYGAIDDGANYEAIVLYIIYPFVRLLESNNMPELGTGDERTFSNEILYLAVKIASDRLNYVKKLRNKRLILLTHTEREEQIELEAQRETDREKIRNAVKRIPEEYRGNAIDTITPDEAIQLLQALRKIRDIIKPYIGESKGAMNCKDDYSNYNRIREAGIALNAAIVDGTHYKPILHFILSPLLSLPTSDTMKPLDDDPRGRKTFSKEILNLAVTLASALLCLVQREWLYTPHRPDLIRQLKEDIRKVVKQIPEGYEDTLMDTVSPVEVEGFNEALGKIGEIIEPYIGGSTGDVNCGDDYSNYNRIREAGEGFNDAIVDGTHYKPILHFILSPLLSLPELYAVKSLEEREGEKTFSKEILNLAVNLASDRLSFVQIEWVYTSNRSYFSRQEREKIRKVVKQIPEGYRHALIDKVTRGEVEGFNEALEQIEGTLGPFIYASRGDVNCGDDYSNYNRIREAGIFLDAIIVDGTHYKPILHFILSPLLCLPTSDTMKSCGNPRGRKTFSKEILNLAVNLASDRLCLVQREWLYTPHRPEKIRQRKEDIRKVVKQIPEGYTLALIDKVTSGAIKAFCQALEKIKREIGSIQSGSTGAVDCGDDYSNYNKIQKSFKDLHEGIKKKTDYEHILRYVILPLATLPESKTMESLEEREGEKTFSKEILNLAVTTSSERLNQVQGYWEHQQKILFSLK